MHETEARFLAFKPATRVNSCCQKVENSAILLKSKGTNIIFIYYLFLTLFRLKNVQWNLCEKQQNCFEEMAEESARDLATVPDVHIIPYHHHHTGGWCVCVCVCGVKNQLISCQCVTVSAAIHYSVTHFHRYFVAVMQAKQQYGTVCCYHQHDIYYIFNDSLFLIYKFRR